MTVRSRTFCRICEPMCPIVATVDAGIVVKLEPDREHPVSGGFACHKGLNFLQVHADPDRANHPMRRTTPKSVLPASFEPCTWDAAFADIGERLRAIGYTNNLTAEVTGGASGLRCPRFGVWLGCSREPM